MVSLCPSHHVRDKGMEAFVSSSFSLTAVTSKVIIVFSVEVCFVYPVLLMKYVKLLYFVTQNWPNIPFLSV